MAILLPQGYTIKEKVIFKNGKQKWKYSIYFRDTELCGSVVLKFKEIGLTIVNLKVDQMHRNKGLSKVLLQTVIDAHGHNYLYIRPRPFNDKPVEQDKLHEVYERFGFMDFGTEGRMVRLPWSNENIYELGALD